MKTKKLKNWKKLPPGEIMEIADEMYLYAERIILNTTIKGERIPRSQWTPEQTRELQKALWGNLVKRIREYTDEWGYIAIRKETKRGKIKTWKLDLYDAEFPKVSVIEVEADPDIVIK